RFVRQQLPSWNKSVLDRWVKRAFEKADPTRPTVAHGGVLPHLPQLDGTDSHLWLGWHRGEVHELADRARAVPRLVRFVSEFGAQSVPLSATSPTCSVTTSRRCAGSSTGRREASASRGWPTPVR